MSDIFTDLKVVWLEEKGHHVEDELRVVTAIHMVPIVEAASLVQEVLAMLETAMVDGGGYGVARAGGHHGV